MKMMLALDALAALAQETRLRVFRLLVQEGPGGLSAGEIATKLKLAPATLTFHAAQLRHAGLVTSKREGRNILYRANFDSMNALMTYLTENCCQGEDCGVPAACGPANEPLPAKSAKRRRNA
ncbi:MAG: helix-turn-helix transcriptional regulator [Alphaproteobacteria bacterium]|nr:helix-turn-helix transcriptional regulator [Alphaproteobacteria bacterium]